MPSGSAFAAVIIDWLTAVLVANEAHQKKD